MTNAYIIALALIGACTVAKHAMRIIIKLYIGGFNNG